MFLQLFRVVYIPAYLLPDLFKKKNFIPTTGGSADLGAEVIQQQNLAFKHATLPKFLKEYILCSFNYFG